MLTVGRLFLGSLFGQKGTGALPQPDDSRDWDISKLKLAGSSRGPRLRDSIPEIYDQGAVSSCVANALVGAVRTAARARNREVPPLSRLALYYAARAVDGHQTKDAGTRPRSAVYALSKLGLPREERWPYKLSRVNTSPPGAMYQLASWRGMRGYYWISDSKRGDSLFDQVTEALAAQYPVLVSIPVGSNFSGYKPGEQLAPPKTTTSYHSVYIVDGNAKSGFTFVNSWGTRWGNGGLGILSAAYLNDVRCFAKLVVDLDI